ncbi:MAG: linear amide C-N hydrolase [Mobilitalea sp.]
MRGKYKLRILRNVFFVLLGLILVFTSIIYISFYNEILTISSIKKINTVPVYEMNYKGNFGFDKYLKTGSKNYSEYADFMNANLLKGIPEFYYDKFECSTFFARTPEGDYIMGRNYDTEVSIPFVLRTNSKKGFKTVGMADLRNPGWNNTNLVSRMTALSAPYYTFDGMNENGVAIAGLSVPFGARSDIDESKTTLYDYAVIRLTLEKAENVDDAIKQLSQYNIKMENTYPSHYMIADEAGNCAIIDYVDGSMKVIRKDDNYQIATNMLTFNNDKHQGYSADRYQNFDKVLSEKSGVISIEDALELLVENTVPGDEQWSSVYNLTDKTMSVKFHGDYENTYTYEIEEKP